jgi:hypothetical protein
LKIISRAKSITSILDRRSHNLKVVGSNPTPATTAIIDSSARSAAASSDTRRSAAGLPWISSSGWLVRADRTNNDLLDQRMNAHGAACRR